MRILIFLLFISLSWAQDLLLLSVLTTPIENPKQFLVSEKLDGVRAYWNGKELISRNGKKLSAPNDFLKDFPPFPIDGELWTKRGDFENIVSIINSKDTSRWGELNLYVFEVPNQNGGLASRLAVLQKYIDKNSPKHIKIIKQNSISSQKELDSMLEEVIKGGGEGLVLRDRNAPYYTGRDKRSLKLKKYFDSECKIDSYTEGEGKLKGKVGAIICIDGNKKIKIGSGLSDALRANPPKIGSTITYKYYGTTKNGNPKYPVFLRIREDVGAK